MTDQPHAANDRISRTYHGTLCPFNIQGWKSSGTAVELDVDQVSWLLAPQVARDKDGLHQLTVILQGAGQGVLTGYDQSRLISSEEVIQLLFAAAADVRRFWRSC